MCISHGAGESVCFVVFGARRCGTWGCGVSGLAVKAQIECQDVLDWLLVIMLLRRKLCGVLVQWGLCNLASNSSHALHAR
jgi:hypothetical protein